MNQSERFHKKVKEQSISGKRVYPLRAIRAFCLECSGFIAEEVRKCEFGECVLYRLRFGRNLSGRSQKRTHSVSASRKPPNKSN